MSDKDRQAKKRRGIEELFSKPIAIAILFIGSATPEVLILTSILIDHKRNCLFANSHGLN